MAEATQPSQEELDACINAYSAERHRIGIFGGSVRDFFASHPELTAGDLPAIHSVKYREKNEEHLRKKIIRKKLVEGRVITPENLFSEITDLVGVRVLYLHKEQFVQIHEKIEEQKRLGHWHPFEDPKAYTWDPELSKFFEGLGIQTHFRESHYTSVHYVVKPNDKLPIACEIQVRTLFEETWGEIDHVLNYPDQTDSIACKEQLRVLAKLVRSGPAKPDRGISEVLL